MADCVTRKEVLSSSLTSYIVLPVCLVTSLKSEVKPEENFPPSHPVQDLQGDARNLGLDARTWMVLNRVQMPIWVHHWGLDAYWVHHLGLQSRGPSPGTSSRGSSPCS